jgi:uncharacterized protein with HEPN domain
MRKHPERVPDYLDYILDAINQINDYITGLELEQFLESRLVQDAVARNVEIVGEASHRILVSDDDFEELHPRIELTRAYRTRNAVIHGYEEVDFTIVWRVATINLPLLKQAILDFKER